MSDAGVAQTPPAPGWISPSPGSTLGGTVLLDVATYAAGYLTQGVAFLCKEEPGNGCLGSGWMPCNGPNMNQGGGSQRQTTSEHYSLGWWSPVYPSGQYGPPYSHNGTWSLMAEVTYLRPKPTPLYITVAVPIITVTLANPAPASLECDKALPSIPSDVGAFWIDPEAAGTGRETATFTWDFDQGMGPAEATITLRILDAVSGATVTEQALLGLEDTYTWDGSTDGGGAKVGRGIYTYSIAVNVVQIGGVQHSPYLALSGVQAIPQPYDEDGGKLPFSLAYSLADSSDLAASAASAYVYRFAPSDTDGPVLIDGPIGLDTDLGTNTAELELEPLDGSPYYIMVYARDDHHDLPMPDGDRLHEQRPALPVALRLEYRVSQVWPYDDGRIFMSDHIGADPGAYAVDPMLGHYIGFGESPALWGECTWGGYWAGRGRKCQPACLDGSDYGANTRQKAWVEAETKLTVVDRVDGNESSTVDQDCGGATVHFWLQDPDSTFLWDVNGDDDDPATLAIDCAGDNVGSATVDASACSSLVTRVSGMYAETKSVAATVLDFGEAQGGDNFGVVASPNVRPANAVPPIPGIGILDGCHDINGYVPPGGDVSGILEVWRLLYYERDQAKKSDEGDPKAWDLRFPALGDTACVEGDATALAGEAVCIYDSSYARPDDWYTVSDATLDDGLTVLQLDRQVTRPYGAPDNGQVALLNAPLVDILFDDSQLPAELAKSYGDREGYVRYAPYPRPADEGRLAPALDIYFGQPPDYFGRFFGYFDHREEPNVVHIVESWREYVKNCYGIAQEATRQVVIIRYLHDALVSASYSLNTATWETLVHELGHIFGLGDYGDPLDPGHPLHMCHDGSDGCVMLYDAGTYDDRWNDIALFGGETSPPAEPTDLRNDIAGHADPLQ